MTATGSILAAKLLSADGVTAAGAGMMVDAYNRQLHPQEISLIKANAAVFAQQQGISEEEATQRLTQQALRDVDFLWRAQLADGDDAPAKVYLGRSVQSFSNELGKQQMGARALGNTADGRQGSLGWITGGGMLEKAVGDDNAVPIERAVKAGRVETWVVTTRANGATEVQVLDAFGAPKFVGNSKIIFPNVSISGARP